MAILFGGWYQTPFEQYFRGLGSDVELDAELNRIVDFERMLINDGALLVKFWFHLAEQDQKARPEELSRDDHSRWKMLPKKGKFHQHYHKYERTQIRAHRRARHPAYRPRDLTLVLVPDRGPGPTLPGPHRR